MRSFGKKKPFFDKVFKFGCEWTFRDACKSARRGAFRIQSVRSPCMNDHLCAAEFVGMRRPYLIYNGKFNDATGIIRILADAPRGNGVLIFLRWAESTLLGA